MGLKQPSKYSDNQPLVSVIVPAYNAADLTVLTVKSILAQTYRNIEIIVVDDGSTDDTPQKLKAFNDRIQYIRKQNGGACSARNVGISKARGKLIAFLDCDDLYLPAKIEKSVAYLNAHPDVGMVHTGLFYVDEKGGVLRTSGIDRISYQGWIKEKLIIVNMISNTTVLIKKECFKKAGVFDETLFPPADWDMWLRISEKFKVGYINEPLSMYRVSSNWNFRNLARVIEEERIVLENFFKRNPDVSSRIKNRAYSRYYYTVAKNYAAQKLYGDMKHHLLLAMAYNPLNVKANAMFLLYLINRESLSRKAAQSLFV